MQQLKPKQQQQLRQQQQQGKQGQQGMPMAHAACTLTRTALASQA
jgi:hypothetical protein